MTVCQDLGEQRHFVLQSHLPAPEQSWPELLDHAAQAHGALLGGPGPADVIDYRQIISFPN